jgi:hypothetical protein
VETSQHFCPNPDYANQGWVKLGNLSPDGHPSGGPWRQLHCIVCDRYFLERHGTPLHGRHVLPDLLVWAVGALAEGVGVRAVARVFEVDPNTVLQWLVEAEDQLQAFSQHFLHDVCVTQVQLDVLYALLSRRRRLVRVSHRVVFGTLSAIEQVLAAHDWHINTAFIERVNLTIRQHVAVVVRRVMTLCKVEDGLRQQLALYHGYYNFCLPHASLRQPLPQPEPTNGSGSAIAGSLGRRRWPLAWRITSGPCVKCCGSAYRRGHSRRPCKRLTRRNIRKLSEPGVPADRQGGRHQTSESRLKCS